jgi:integrase
MNRIHSGDIYDLRSHLTAKKLKKGKSLSAKSINNYLLALSGLFSDALDDSVVETNPVKIKKHRLDYEQKEADHFRPKEMRELLKHVSQNLYPFFFLLWDTGLRIGEAIGLKWSDFDWQSNVININRTIYESRNGKIEVKPKIKEGKRFVLITPQLRTVIETYRDEKKVQSVEGFVFERKGTPLGRGGIVRTEFKRAVQKAGLRQSLTLHSIRHGHITIVRLNFPEWLTKRLVGHSSPYTSRDISDRYTHVTDFREYAEKLGELLNSDVSFELTNGTNFLYK